VSACADCGAPLTGRHCAACGQDSAARLDRPLRGLVADAVSETLSLDGRVARPLVPLVARPGAVAAEYVAGRRTRYTSPLRLYLAASLLFFVGSTLAPGRGGRLRFDDGTATDPRATPSAEERAEDVAQVTAHLRALGAPGRVIAERLDAMAAMSPQEAERRFDAAFAENAPRVLFFLVPLLAAYLKVLYRRRYYAEHLVLALHAQTVGYLALLPAELSGVGGLLALGVLAAVAWTALALRRLSGEPWRRTIPKLAALAVAFGFSWALLVGALGVVALLST
jgi:hypothetical protein